MNNRTVAIAAWAFAATIFAGAYAAQTAGYAVNVTESMPRGLWRITPMTREPRAGDVVAFCPTDTAPFRLAKERDYIPGGHCPDGYTPVIKPIAATAGDRINVTSLGVIINGTPIPNTAPATRDSAGRPLFPQIGSVTVPAGSLWFLATRVPNSYDSRYFGAVPATAIIGHAQPVLTER
ncbi:MAG: conjugative transfer signal peptidase TraF [Magnetospirillum sp.]|nr:conjugative transfer signal peptidase TraF [Magnetospirillum sp.]